MVRALLVRALLLVAIIALAAVLAEQELRRRWESPLVVADGGFHLTVARGESLRSVIEALHEAGVVRYPRLLILYGRWTGMDQKIRRGEYRLPASSTAQSLLELLTSGDVITYQVTLPEGITIARALQILQQQKELTAVLQGLEDARILALAAPHDSVEGLFFPDSYRFERGDTDLQILERARRAMRDVLDQEWSGKGAAAVPYANKYEALIMASIVERETGLAQERDAVAGVFVRRLQKGMLLQTDPTVIYGLGPSFDGNLTRHHLADAANPYNTYRHRGLPPTPIALPGRAAIHAALHPGQGNALYFVARGDGGHVFSDTLAEHNRAVRKYQLQRRENYRSTPPPQE